MLERPSKVLAYINRLSQVMGFVGTHSGIDHTHYPPRAHGHHRRRLERFCRPRRQVDGQILERSDDAEHQRGYPGVVYSDFARAFVRVPSLIKGAQQWSKTILAENWLDRSSCAACAPFWVREDSRSSTAKILEAFAQATQRSSARFSRRRQNRCPFGGFGVQVRSSMPRGWCQLCQRGNWCAYSPAWATRLCSALCSGRVYGAVSAEYIPEIVSCVRGAHALYGPSATSGISRWSWDPA